MNHLFTFKYDEENDRYEIHYQGSYHIELVYISGEAMEELAGSSPIGVKEKNDIGTAIVEFLYSEGVSSPKGNPVLILPEAYGGAINNGLTITPKLKDVSNKYLNE